MRIFCSLLSQVNVFHNTDNIEKYYINSEISMSEKNKENTNTANLKRSKGLLNFSYYYVKPFIFRKIQIFLRRILAKRKRREISNIWPIFPGSEMMSENWPGWPPGKKFALILTHDVELKKGYNRILKLMELEKRLGFISTFLLIPERGLYGTKGIIDHLKNQRIRLRCARSET